MNFLFQFDMRTLNDFQFAMTKHSINFSAYCFMIYIIFSDINVILFVNLLMTVRIALNSLSDKTRMKFRVSV